MINVFSHFSVNWNKSRTACTSLLPWQSPVRHAPILVWWSAGGHAERYYPTRLLLRRRIVLSLQLPLGVMLTLTLCSKRPFFFFFFKADQARVDDKNLAALRAKWHLVSPLINSLARRTLQRTDSGALHARKSIRERGRAMRFRLLKYQQRKALDEKVILKEQFTQNDWTSLSKIGGSLSVRHAFLHLKRPPVSNIAVYIGTGRPLRGVSLIYN